MQYIFPKLTEDEKDTLMEFLSEKEDELKNFAMDHFTTEDDKCRLEDLQRIMNKIEVGE